MITPILNINFKNIYKIPFSSNKQVEKSVVEPSNDSFECNIQPKVDDLGMNLQKLNGISCPVCGTKMLNEEKYNQILEEAKQIKSPYDYLRLVSKNQEYLPTYNKDVVSAAAKIIKSNSKIELTDFLLQMRKAGCDKMSDEIDNSIEYLQDKVDLESFTLLDEKLVKKCIKNLKAEKSDDSKYYDYHNLKKIINDTLGKLEAQDQRKIYNHVMNSIKSASLNQTALFVPDLENNSKQECMMFAFRSLFKGSQNVLTQITDNEKFEEIPANRVLICGDCNSFRHKRDTFFPKRADYDKLQRNFNTYLEDLTHAMGTETLNVEPKYLLKFANIMKWASASRVEIPFRDITGKIEHVKFVRERPDFLPIEIDEDIPCSSCGTPMINQQKKRLIMSEIRKSKNVQELGSILNKYEKYIHSELKWYVDLIKDISTENPNIDGKELMLEIQLAASTRVRNELKNIIQTLNQKGNSDIGTAEERENLKIFARNLEDMFLQSRNIQYFDYVRFRNLSKRDLQHQNLDKFKIKDLIFYDFRHCIAISNLAYPLESAMIKNNNDEYKAFIQGLFKASGFTVDHFVAKKRNGDNNLKNLIGMCKLCNASKSSIAPREWARIHPASQQYMLENLRTMERLNQEGKLPGFDNYVHDIAYFVYNLTDSRIDLRVHFPKKKQNKKQI